MQLSPFIDAGEAYDADIEVQGSVAAAPAHPSVSMVFPPSPSSSQYVVSPPGPSTSYCVTMASPTTSHPLFPLRNPQRMSFVSHLHFTQFKGMIIDRVGSFLDARIDLEILVDLEAELEVEAWEGDVVGMLHFLLLDHLLQH